MISLPGIDTGLDHYFAKGYVVRRLPRDLTDALDRLVACMESEWRDCPPDDREQILRLPLWNPGALDDAQQGQGGARDFAALQRQETALAAACAARRPRVYDRFFDGLIRQDAFFQALKSLFRLEMTGIQLWDGVGAPYWHWDGPGNGDLYMLLYLTDHLDWPESYGGGLRLGVRELSPGWLAQVNEAAVTVIDEVKPSRGTLVVSDNRNPRIVHCPERLTDEAIARGERRLTFLVTFSARL